MNFNWKKCGLIYSSPNDGSWKDNSALTPTPVFINEKKLRVFAGFRDPEGVSRIGYVDLNPDNPKEILNISPKPVIDLGQPGTFDDNGMILGDILKFNNKLYMYYVGFQKVAKVKFYAFSGLAVSLDNGENFERISETPVLDRSDEGKFIRAVHSVHRKIDKFQIWYAAGNKWQIINGKPYPSYSIYSLESEDGIHFPKKGKKCINFNKLNNEYRIGRPRVFKVESEKIMHYTYGTLQGSYKAGIAFLKNGSWVRNDDKIGIGLSMKGWDSKHLCYPALIKYNNRLFMFYNGNNMGYEGFGYAEASWSS